MKIYELRAEPTALRWSHDPNIRTVGKEPVQTHLIHKWEPDVELKVLKTVLVRPTFSHVDGLNQEWRSKPSVDKCLGEETHGGLLDKTGLIRTSTETSPR